MRTISEIKEYITLNFMNDSTIAQKYGFTKGASFSETFSPTSIENLLFYYISVAIQVLEGLFDAFKTEVNDTVDNMQPHRPKWYRNKVLAFMKGYPLVSDSDYYDTSNMTEDEIEAAQVVKYAAVTESKDSSLLTIKVAGESNGSLAPLDDATATQLQSYIAEIKDAGVRYSLVNQDADEFSCTIEVYYDAMIEADTVKQNVKDAIEGYITGLPFNGEYSNMGCIDAVQEAEGVKIAEITSASVKISGESTSTTINVRHTPAAGYMTADTITINMHAYE